MKDEENEIVIRCPLCNGSGTIKEGHHSNPNMKEQKVRIAHLLKKEGYSHRQIMSILNYKSPLSVTLLLKEPNPETLK